MGFGRGDPRLGQFGADRVEEIALFLDLAA